MAQQTPRKLSGRLGVLGAGVMGQALIRGVLRSQAASPAQLWGAARSAATCDKIRAELGIAATVDYTPELATTDVLLLCVKPQQVPEVLAGLGERGLRPETLIVSIAAGVTLAAMEQACPLPNPLVRVMTNTPCLVGAGMTVACGGRGATDQHLATARTIFESVGDFLELEEGHFDAVTGLSGSGPAYLFLIMEALADGGVRVGLPRRTALRLVTQTVLGSARMLDSLGEHPAALKDGVTTPAGCTIGALLLMEDGKIRSVLARAVEEATRIAGSLGD